jgi:DNA polymerase-1
MLPELWYNITKLKVIIKLRIKEKKMPKAVILDTSAIMYRTHFALMGMRNSKGKATGATYGFINTLNGIIKEFSPDYLVACLDIKRSELKRTSELTEYKAHRQDMPEELVYQLPKIMEVLDGYNIPKYKVDGYEADDVIATLATKFAEDNMEVYIVTGDKDLMQLIKDNINIALLGKGEGKSLFKYIQTEQDVVDYLGVRPDQVIDLFGLMGDKSDGIPGVQGIGPKTGVELITKYGNLETLYENIGDLKGKRKEKLENEKENAFLSRELATVHTELEVEYDKEKLKYEEKDMSKLLPLYKEMEFKRFLEDAERAKKAASPLQGTLFQTAVQEKPAVKEVKDEAPFQYEILDTAEKVEKAVSGLDSEVTLFDNEMGYGISDKKKNYYIPCEIISDRADFLKKFKDKYVNAYNIKELFKEGLLYKDYFDIMLVWYVLGTEAAQDLESIIFSEFQILLEKYEVEFKKQNMSEVSVERKAEFLTKRSYYMVKLKDILESRLEAEGLNNVYENIEKKLAPVLAAMEKKGILIDPDYFEKYGNELKNNLVEIEKKIYGLAGEEFNINSPKQLSEVLFEKMMLNPVKKTKTGYSTDVEVLEILASQGVEVAEKILEYRGYTKLLTTYVEPLPKLADKENRIHTTFHQNGTATGRLSSSNPNIQNIPVKTDEGIKIRRGFVSQEGWSFISFDYSQIELRVLAELSGDEVLIHAYQKDKDLHDLTARKLFFKTDEEPVSREERSIAKVINFSILYGKTPFGLSKELKIPMSDAKLYINKYFEEYPKVRNFLNNVLQEAKLNGFVETLYGTRRYITGINSSNKNTEAQADRMAVNTVVQGTAANIIKKVMIKLYEEIKDKEDINMLLQVHDELIFEVKNESVDKYLKEIDNIMENTIKLKSVRLAANGNVGKNWGELK